MEIEVKLYIVIETGTKEDNAPESPWQVARAMAEDMADDVAKGHGVNVEATVSIPEDKEWDT